MLRHNYDTPITLSHPFLKLKNNKIRVFLYKVRYSPKGPLIIGSPVFLDRGLRIAKLINKNNRSRSVGSRIAYIGSSYVSEAQLQELYKYTTEFSKMVLALQEHDGQFVHGDFIPELKVVSNKSHVEDPIEDEFASMYCVKNYLIIPFDFELLHEMSKGKLTSMKHINEFVRKESVTEVLRLQHEYATTVSSLMKDIRNSEQVDDTRLIGSVVRDDKNQYYLYCSTLGALPKMILADYVKSVCRLCYRYGRPDNTMNDFMAKVKSLYDKDFLSANLKLDLVTIVGKVLDFREEEDFGLFMPLKQFRHEQLKNLNWMRANYAVCVKLPSVEDYAYNVLECFNQKYNSNANLYQQLVDKSIQPSKLCIVPVNSLHATLFRGSGIHPWFETLGQLIAFERLVIVKECQKLYGLQDIALEYVQAALTHKSVNAENNYEVYETIGDAALKLIASLHVFIKDEKSNEHIMSKEKQQIVSNEPLGKLGRLHQLQFFIQSENKKVKYLTMPGFKLNPKSDYRKKFLTTNNLGSKVVPDAVESLIGAAVVQTGNLYYSLHVMDRFDVLKEFNFKGFEPTFTSTLKIKQAYFDYLHDNRKSIHINVTFKQLYTFLDRAALPPNLKNKRLRCANVQSVINKFAINAESIEDIQRARANVYNVLLLEHQRKNLRYVFKNRKLLRQCLRPSTLEFERLEFFGDAVIEIYALYNMFLLQKRYGFESSPETLHGVKVALLSTYPLAKLNYLLGHYKFLNLSVEPNYITMLDKIAHDTKYKNQWIDAGLNKTKILADSFESLIGALYMDGGWRAVRKVLDRVFLPFIYFFARYCKTMVTDMKHIVYEHFITKGLKVEIEYDSDKQICRLLLGMENKVAYEVECENKRAGEVMLWALAIRDINEKKE